MLPLRVKICGVTRPIDIQSCIEAGADAVGINFHPGSPRYVEPTQSQPLLRTLPPLMAGVGVFVGLPMRQISALCYQLGLRAIQFHGDQREIIDPFPFTLVTAFRVRDANSLDEITTYLEKAREIGHPPSALLIDAYVEDQHGGTGKTAPWALLADFRPNVPIILAGGLNPDNVAEAIRIVRPAGVDVASGVEFAPGKKDPELVKKFVMNAREAAAKVS